MTHPVFGPYSIASLTSLAAFGVAAPGYFSGALDEIRWYSRALSAYEIAAVVAAAP